MWTISPEVEPAKFRLCAPRERLFYSVFMNGPWDLLIYRIVMHQMKTRFICISNQNNYGYPAIKKIRNGMSEHSPRMESV